MQATSTSVSLINICIVHRMAECLHQLSYTFLVNYLIFIMTTSIWIITICLPTNDLIFKCIIILYFRCEVLMMCSNSVFQAYTFVLFFMYPLLRTYFIFFKAIRNHYCRFTLHSVCTWKHHWCLFYFEHIRIKVELFIYWRVLTIHKTSFALSSFYIKLAPIELQIIPDNTNRKRSLL